MDLIKKIFPFSFKAADVVGLIISIVIYVVAPTVLGILGNIPLIGFVFDILAWAAGIYCTIGIVLSILYFVKVIK